MNEYLIMHMRRRRESGGAHFSNLLPFMNLLTYFNGDGLQVKIDRHHALPMIDHDGIAMGLKPGG